MTDQIQPTVVLKDGLPMPQFGLGVFQTPPDATERIVRLAVDEGYRLVDTAAMYRNEDGVGKALLGRTDVFVTTKLGNSDHGFDETLRAFDVSMRRLGRDTLDLDQVDPEARAAHRFCSSHSESWAIEETMPSGIDVDRSSSSGRNLPVRTSTVLIPCTCAPTTSPSRSSARDVPLIRSLAPSGCRLCSAQNGPDQHPRGQARIDRDRPSRADAVHPLPNCCHVLICLWRAYGGFKDSIRRLRFC